MSKRNKNRIRLEDHYNLRYLGNYKTSDSKTTIKGNFIRSDGGNFITEEDIKVIKDTLKLSVVIDLRSYEVASKYQDPFKDLDFISYHNIEINGKGRLPTSYDDVIDSYLEMLENDPIKEIFKVIASFSVTNKERILSSNYKDNRSLLYHCSAGKDRTGVVTILLLLLCKVTKEEIVRDYMTTSYFYRPELKGTSHLPEDYNPDVIKCHRQYPIRFMDAFHSKYGNIEKFLKEVINLTDTEIEAIRFNLLGE